MAIDFAALLTDEQKRSILQQRLAQFASEGYQHEINKTVAQAADNTAGVEAADEALTILEKAIEVHQEELAKLPAAE
jgi:thiazole synthase ThiGH ThiG subunit